MNNGCILTVFTPTYNRAATLPRTYNSLCRQTNHNFKWLIIDDGSTDNTKEQVMLWIEESPFEIEYVYKENGGMHTAHNVAYKMIETELNVCIDSDDAMPEDAVNSIITFWIEHRNKELAGIIAYDGDFNGNLICDSFPEGLFVTTATELEDKLRCSGDKKFVYRTDVVRQIPEYPEFPGEKLVPLGYKHLLIDKKYRMVLFPKIICNVEYQVDGSTNTIIKQYFESPNGFIAARINTMLNSPYMKERLRANIHYIAESLIAKKKRFITASPSALTTVFLLPVGVLLYLYLLNRVKQYDDPNG